ncbi:Hypothetical protein FKW44_012029 [Caligus rogercresseyi]|uniref:Uncharacterized protein n=1 Tax=Caligus rogercresseyi TaxID=217165 RepID=A0A7T8HK22_CALRO|nr:Hypothetical protein FKW44_012029 [Caligus rogercresseyi]
MPLQRCIGSPGTNRKVNQREGSTPGNEKKEDSGALEESTPARTTEVNELKEEEEEEEKKTKKAEKQAQDEGEDLGS